MISRFPIIYCALKLFRHKIQLSYQKSIKNISKGCLGIIKLCTLALQKRLIFSRRELPCFMSNHEKLHWRICILWIFTFIAFFTSYYICRWFDITYAGAQPLLHLQLTGITNAGAIFYYICRYFITFAGIITFGVDVFITYAGGITFAGVITFAVVTTIHLPHIYY